MAKSPIESAMIGSLVDAVASRGWGLCEQHGVSIAFDEHNGVPHVVDEAGRQSSPFYYETDVEVAVMPQARVAGYKADIAVALRMGRIPWWSFVLVECDGHEWHERTPQQASRDRARDRDIAARCSLTPVRFTGSEIVRSPDMCAKEVLDLALVNMRRMTSFIDYVRNDLRSEMAVAALVASFEEQPTERAR